MVIELDPGGLRKRATSLRSVADDLAWTVAQIGAALAAIGQTSLSVSALVEVAARMRERATDLDHRAGFVEAFQPIELVASAPHWDPRLYADLPVSDADAHLLLADLWRRLESWAGSDNDPALERLVAVARELRERVGTTEADLQRLSRAMAAGETPEEAGLPSGLFPADYLLLMEERRQVLRLIADLEARATDLERTLLVLHAANGASPAAPLAQLPPGSLPFDALASELKSVRADLRAAQGRLAGLRLPGPSEIVDHLRQLPAATSSDRRRAVGAYLASCFADAMDGGDYLALAEIGRILSGPAASPLEAVAFFNAAGPEGVADIPNRVGWLSAPTGVAPPGDAPPPGDVIAWYSAALAAASHTGRLGFGGDDLVDAYTDRAGDENLELSGVDVAYLFVVGGFDREFLIAATAAYLPYAWPEGREAQVAVILPGMPTDPRSFLLPQVAELEAGVELVLALGDNAGVLIDPRSPYPDDEWLWRALFLILVGVAANLDPTGTPTPGAAQAAEVLLRAAGGGVHPGLEPAVAALFGPHLDLLLPATRPGSTIAVTTAVDLTETEVSGALVTVLGDPAAAAVLRQILYAFAVRQAVAGQASGTAPELIGDDLGDILGRIQAVQAQVAVDEAGELDRSDAFRGAAVESASGVLAGLLIPTTAPARFSKVGASLYELIAGAVAGLGTGALVEYHYGGGHTEEALADALDRLAADGTLQLYHLVVAAGDELGPHPEPPAAIELPAPPGEDASEAEVQAWQAQVAAWPGDMAAWAADVESWEVAFVEWAADQPPDGLARYLTNLAGQMALHSIRWAGSAR